MNRKLSKVELTNFIEGAGFLATGGGGLISVGEQILNNIYSQKKNVSILSPWDLEDNAIGVSTVMLGGGISIDDLNKINFISQKPISLKATYRLQEYLKKEVDFIYAIEIGPQNSLEAMQLAAFLGKPLVDGDFAGRAVPEMQQTTLSLNGISLTPFSIETFSGDSLIVTHSNNDKRNEEICRNIANISGGVICIAGFTLSGKQVKEIIIDQTISKCIKIGEIIRNRPQSMFSDILEITGGRITFKGKVVKINTNNKNSFFIGEIILKGIKEYSGQSYKIWYKNEFMISWKDNEPDITCPDLICIANMETGVGKVSYGESFRNGIVEGEKIIVFGIPSPEAWKQPKGLKVLSPNSFGFNINYKPI